MIRCAARSVIPVKSATSRILISGFRAIQRSTCVWLVTKRQGFSSEGLLDIDDIFVVTFRASVCRSHATSWIDARKDRGICGSRLESGEPQPVHLSRSQ